MPDLWNELRRAFKPTPEEELERLRFSVECHEWCKTEKHCCTCTNWTPPPKYLPGFVEDHGDCSKGHVVDTIDNCPDYIQSDDSAVMGPILNRIKELEEIVKGEKGA